jgi:hypothetical protein
VFLVLILIEPDGGLRGGIGERAVPCAVATLMTLPAVTSAAVVV